MPTKKNGLIGWCRDGYKNTRREISELAEKHQDFIEDVKEEIAWTFLAIMLAALLESAHTHEKESA